MLNNTETLDTIRACVQAEGSAETRDLQFEFHSISNTIQANFQASPSDTLWMLSIYFLDSLGRTTGIAKKSFTGRVTFLDLGAINCENAKPTAFSRSDTTVSINDTVMLVGTGTDSFGGGITRYEWYSKERGYPILIGNTANVAYQVSNVPSQFCCDLLVWDNDGNLAACSIAINVVLDPPVANAGKDTAVNYGSTAVLEGTAVDTRGSILKYEWDLDGSQDSFSYTVSSNGLANLTGLTEDRTAFLRVTDDDGNSSVDSVWIKVGPGPVVFGLGNTFSNSTQLSWGKSQVNDFSLYQIRYSTARTDSPNVVQTRNIQNKDQLSCTINGLRQNMKYVFTLSVQDTTGLFSTSTAETICTLTPWSLLPRMPTGRYGSTACAFDGKIYVIGGKCVGLLNDTNVVEIYDPTSGSWSTGAAMPTSRTLLQSVSEAGKIFAIGGQKSQNINLNVVEAYDPASDSWVTCAPMPTARSAMGLVNIAGKFYVFGGFSNVEMKPTEIYDPLTNIWKTGPLPTILRHHTTADLIYDKVYVTGGGAYNGEPAAVGEFNPNTGTWITKALPSSSRDWHCTAVYENKLYVLGGYIMDSNRHFYNAEVYDPATDTWDQKFSTSMGTHSYAAACMLNNIVYIFGGYKGLPANLSESYNPALDK